MNQQPTQQRDSPQQPNFPPHPGQSRPGFVAPQSPMIFNPGANKGNPGQSQTGYVPPQPPRLGQPGYVQFGPPHQRGMRSAPRGIYIALAVLVLAIVLLLAMHLRNPSPPTVQQALAAMCTAVENNDFSGLYSMTSSSFMVAYSESDFTTRLPLQLRDSAGDPYDSNGNPVYPRVTGCRVEAVSIDTSHNPPEAQARISLSFSNQAISSSITTLVAENGAWKIDGWISN